MIRITLYRDCILNDKYQNVFGKTAEPPNFQYSPFKEYLNNLIQKTYTIDNVYQDDMTSLNFNLSSDDYSSIYKFNYMQIESLDNQGIVQLVRFAFINSIKIGNDIAQVSYKIDIWHTYINGVNGINMSILNNIRYNNLSGITYKKLPVEYAGNDGLNFTGTETDGLFTNVGLIIQIQVYNTAVFGESTASTSQYFLIDGFTEYRKINSGWLGLDKPINIENVETELERIINLSSGKNFMTSDENEKAYFKIGKVYILKFNTVLSNKFMGYDYIIKEDNRPSSATAYWVYKVRRVESNSALLTEYDNSYFSNDFKIRGIGFKSLFFPVDVNGTNINYKLLLSISKHSFSLILSCQNKFIDISDIFELFPVTTQISGDVLAQQRISRAIQNLHDVGNQVKSAANLVGSLYGENANFIHGQNMYDFYEANYLETGNPSLGMSAGLKSRDIATSNIVGNIFGSVVDIIDTGIKYGARNAPIYNSTGMVKVNNIALLNVINGIGIYTITADNEQYVKDSINNLGYIVYKYTNKLTDLSPIFGVGEDFRSSGVYYNVVRFGTIDLYGDFPLDIAKSLCMILEKGIKIWYYHDIEYALEHDTYAVG